MAMFQTKFSDNSICEMKNSARKKPNMLKNNLLESTTQCYALQQLRRIWLGISA